MVQWNITIYEHVYEHVQMVQWNITIYEHLETKMQIRIAFFATQETPALGSEEQPFYK